VTVDPEATGGAHKEVDEAYGVGKARMEGDGDQEMSGPEDSGSIVGMEAMAGVDEEISEAFGVTKGGMEGEWDREASGPDDSGLIAGGRDGSSGVGRGVSSMCSTDWRCGGSSGTPLQKWRFNGKNMG
jgi:hypothetical protein